jgi:hypothetical protein
MIGKTRTFAGLSRTIPPLINWGEIGVGDKLILHLPGIDHARVVLKYHRLCMSVARIHTNQCAFDEAGGPGNELIGYFLIPF